MLRVCVDTNVWISGLLFSGPPAAVVDLAFKRKFQLVLASIIIEELDRNLKRLGYTPREARRLGRHLVHIADFYEPRGEVRVTENTGDNLVLEAADMGRARYLITGDRTHLLPLERFRHTKIIDPAAFILSFTSRAR